MLHSSPHIDLYSEQSLNCKVKKTGTGSNAEYPYDKFAPIDMAAVVSMNLAYQTLKSELDSVYKNLGLKIEFMIIGSLLNETCTDCSNRIDILIINNGFFNKELYTNTKVFLLELKALRNFTQKHLKTKYPETIIDDSLSLSINLKLNSNDYCFSLFFGLWQYNTIADSSGYFSNKQNICLLNYHKQSLITCNPFKALKKLNKKDENTNGNTRDLIRLLKYIKSRNTKCEKLSGYKIESIIYAMHDELLQKPKDQIILLLIECSLHLKKILDDPLHKNYILSADGFTIFDDFDNPTETEQLIALKDELSRLLRHLVLKAKA